MPAAKYLNKIGCQRELCLPLKMDMIVRAYVTNEIPNVLIEHYL